MGRFERDVTENMRAGCCRLSGNGKLQRPVFLKTESKIVQNPLTYDLHEMVSDEDMREMAQDCENLRKELGE